MSLSQTSKIGIWLIVCISSILFMLFGIGIIICDLFEKSNYAWIQELKDFLYKITHTFAENNEIFSAIFLIISFFFVLYCLFKLLMVILDRE